MPLVHKPVEKHSHLRYRINFSPTTKFVVVLAAKFFLSPAIFWLRKMMWQKSQLFFRKEMTIKYLFLVPFKMNHTCSKPFEMYHSFFAHSICNERVFFNFFVCVWPYRAYYIHLPSTKTVFGCYRNILAAKDWYAST